MDDIKFQVIPSIPEEVDRAKVLEDMLNWALDTNYLGIRDFCLTKLKEEFSKEVLKIHNMMPGFGGD